MPPADTISPTIARLAALRRVGLTRQDIADRAGMRPQALSRMLSGELDPGVARVGRVLVAIGCTWADLDPE